VSIPHVTVTGFVLEPGSTAQMRVCGTQLIVENAISAMR